MCLQGQSFQDTKHVTFSACFIYSLQVGPNDFHGATDRLKPSIKQPRITRQQKVVSPVLSWLATTLLMPLRAGISPRRPVSKMDSSEATGSLLKLPPELSESTCWLVYNNLQHGEG